VIGIITGFIYKDKEIFYLSLCGIFLSTVGFLFVFIAGIGLGLLANPKWLVMLLMLIAKRLY
jgi:hypothetical protein